jgi:hypothetical protein
MTRPVGVLPVLSALMAVDRQQAGNAVTSEQSEFHLGLDRHVGAIACARPRCRNSWIARRSCGQWRLQPPGTVARLVVKILDQELVGENEFTRPRTLRRMNRRCAVAGVD